MAKGRRWSGDGAAESFNHALGDEISSLKTKCKSCSPAELCTIQKVERRLENLKKKHNWRTLVACVKYELQIVSESTRHRQKRKEREAEQRRRFAGGSAGGRCGSAADSIRADKSSSKKGM